MIRTTTRHVADPWLEDRPEGARRALKAVDDARRHATALIADIPSMRDDLERFAADLDAVGSILRGDDAAFRKIRPLTAVHLPAITSSLDAIRDLRERETGERLAAAEREIALCLAAASQARAALAAHEISTLEIETATLRDRLGSEKSPAGDAPGRAGSPPPGFIGAAWARGRSTAAGLTGRARSLGDEVVERAGGGAAAANTYLCGILQDGADTITTPVTARISAARTALSSASLMAILGGAVTAIVFPPAVPFAIGLAALDGMSDFGGTVEREKSQAAKRRADRKSERSKALAGQIARFCGASTTARTETPHVHITIDMTRNSASGTILSGQFAGRGLNEFPRADLTWLAETAPDPETADLIRAYCNAMAPR